MTLTTLLTILVFLIGLYFYARCADPKYAEGYTNQNSQPRCPDLLIQKDSKFYLYNSKLAQVPGVNPIEFDNLDEDDLRKILNVNITNPEDYLNLSIFEFTDSQLEVFNTSIQIIEDNIDYTEKTFNGLVLYAKHTNSTFGSIMQVGHTDDPYQDLYNYVIDLSMIYLNTNYN